MSKIIIILCALTFFTNVYASQMLLDSITITRTATGETKNLYLVVDTEKVKDTPRFNPEFDDLPISLMKAVSLATLAYKEKYEEEPNYVQSVELAKLQCCGSDYWYFKVELLTHHSSKILWGGFVVVLFDGTVIFHREEKLTPPYIKG